MKERNHIAFVSGLMLLLYVSSIMPAMVFHQHHQPIVAYNEATPCEKAIYYAAQSSRCDHKNHINEQIEKCSCCDNHTLSCHAVPCNFTYHTGNFLLRYWSQLVYDTPCCVAAIASSRAPPLFSFDS